MTWKDVLNKVRRNAVVIFPVLIAAADAALSQPDWRQALYVAAGVVLRQYFTSPTFEVEQHKEAAFVAGYLSAIEPPPEEH